MDLYLVQHGKAKPKEEDPDRSLSEEGRLEVERMARYAASIGLQPDLIYQSGKLRAQQTAVMLAQALNPPEGVKPLDGIAPNDDPEKALQSVDSTEHDSLMIVGHLPHLSRLASLLIAGNPAVEVIAFRNGGIVALRRDEEGWRLNWCLVPQVLS